MKVIVVVDIDNAKAAEKTRIFILKSINTAKQMQRIKLKTRILNIYF